MFYVGIASRKDRAKYFRNRNNHWKGYVKKHGEPLVEIIHEGLTKEEAEQIERNMISEMGRKGYEPNGRLVNQSLGGGVNIGWRMPDEARRKITESLKQRPFCPEKSKRMRENNPAKSAEAREKIRQSKLGRKVSDETKAKLSMNSSARRPEVARKISIALTGRVGSLNATSRRVMQLDESESLIAVHESIMQAAKKVNGDFRLISAVCSGKRKRHMGFKWKYADN